MRTNTDAAPTPSSLRIGPGIVVTIRLGELYPSETDPGMPPFACGAYIEVEHLETQAKSIARLAQSEFDSLEIVQRLVDSVTPQSPAEVPANTLRAERTELRLIR